MEEYLSGKIMLKRGKMAYCRCCGHKFTLMEWCKRHIEGKVVCSNCNVLNYGSRFVKY